MQKKGVKRETLPFDSRLNGSEARKVTDSPNVFATERAAVLPGERVFRCV